MVESCPTDRESLTAEVTLSNTCWRSFGATSRNECRRLVWMSSGARQSRRHLLQKGNRLPRVRCTSHPGQGLGCCRLPPFTPLSSLCGSTSWLMLHSHYPESCCWLLHLHPLSFALSHFCPLSVIAFSLSDSHSLFSSHALQRSFCFKKKEREKNPAIWKLRHKMVSETDVGLWDTLRGFPASSDGRTASWIISKWFAHFHVTGVSCGVLPLQAGKCDCWEKPSAWNSSAASLLSEIYNTAICI